MKSLAAPAFRRIDDATESARVGDAFRAIRLGIGILRRGDDRFEVGRHWALIRVQFDSEGQLCADLQVVGDRPVFFLRVAKEDDDLLIYAGLKVARADVDHTRVHVGHIRDGPENWILAHEASVVLLLRHFSLLSPRETREGVVKVSLLKSLHC